MSISDTARSFFDACESGQGWEICKAWCHDGASFSCQADAIADIDTVEAYTGWTKSLLTPLPDIHPEIRTFATDEERNSVIVYAVIHGTQSGEGGPVPPTGKTLAGDYVYVLDFADGKIRHMTKIWNDVQSLKQIGWM